MFAGSQGRNGAAVAGTALAVALLAASASGCAVVNTINRVRHDVNANRSVIQSFTQGLKSGQATAFQATYKTTGGSPTTVTYAAQPPREVAFSQAASGDSGGTSGLDLVSNAQGEYACNKAGGAGWSCQKLSKIEALAQNQLVDFYTPAHWITYLQAFSIAAGFAGDKVTMSSMTVNGFPMKCVDFHAKNVKGQSTICTTSQDILGYVKVAGESTSFEITSYKSQPDPALFRLPPGAKITKSS
jgi:hypothetical protein